MPFGIAAPVLPCGLRCAGDSETCAACGLPGSAIQSLLDVNGDSQTSCKCLLFGTSLPRTMGGGCCCDRLWPACVFLLVTPRDDTFFSSADRPFNSDVSLLSSADKASNTDAPASSKSPSSSKDCLPMQSQSSAALSHRVACSVRWLPSPPDAAESLDLGVLGAADSKAAPRALTPVSPLPRLQPRALLPFLGWDEPERFWLMAADAFVAGARAVLAELGDV